MYRRLLEEAIELAASREFQTRPEFTPVAPAASQPSITVAPVEESSWGTFFKRIFSGDGTDFCYIIFNYDCRRTYSISTNYSVKTRPTKPKAKETATCAPSGCSGPFHDTARR